MTGERNRFESVFVGVRAGEGDALAMGAGVEIARRVGCAAVPVIVVPRGEDPAEAGRHVAERLAAAGFEPGRGAIGHVRVVTSDEIGEGLDLACSEAPRPLLVIGPHAHHGLLDFGSTARGFLGASDASLWVQPRPWTELRSVVIAVGHAPEEVDAVSDACAFLSAFAPMRVRAVRCWQPPMIAGQGAPIPQYTLQHEVDAFREAFEVALAKVEWHGLEHEHEVLTGVLPTVLLEQAADEDLVALAAHGRTGLARLLEGNVSAKVAKHSDVPVLALHV